MGEKGAIVSKQQLSDVFVDGFRACEETPKVEATAVCSEANVDAVWQVLNVGARTHPCLTPLEMGKLPDRDPLYFT